MIRGLSLTVAVFAQTTLPIFKNRMFTVKRRFSDFLGLYQKLSLKHSQNGYIVPPPPEKSILGNGLLLHITECTVSSDHNHLAVECRSNPNPARDSMVPCCFTGMTKVKVGKEDQSSAEFVERRRAALERWNSIGWPAHHWALCTTDSPCAVHVFSSLSTEHRLIRQYHFLNTANNIVPMFSVGFFSAGISRGWFLIHTFYKILISRNSWRKMRWDHFIFLPLGLEASWLVHFITKTSSLCGNALYGQNYWDTWSLHPQGLL